MPGRSTSEEVESQFAHAPATQSVGAVRSHAEHGNEGDDEGGIVVDVANEQSLVEVDSDRLRKAVTMIIEDAGFNSGSISVAVVDDATIARLHGEYLDDSDPTDVMSFLLERHQHGIEGEVVVSAETAAAAAGQYGWLPQHELLLYVIHGTLHLVGYRDRAPQQQAEMRRQEKLYLARLGVRADCDQADAAPRDAAPRDGGRGGQQVP